MYAATQALESLSNLLSKAYARNKHTELSKVMFNDISRAYFNAPLVRPVCVEIPDEDLSDGDESMCARRTYSM